MRRITVIAASVLALGGFALATPAGAETKDAGPVTAAASCGRNAPDLDDGAWNATATTAANQRSGSSTSCTIRGVAQVSDRLDYHCYTVAGSYTWTYLRNVRTGVEGWVRDDLLRDNGSYDWCGF